MRDYEQWHRAYDDPTSGLSWRLTTVQSHLRDALERHSGPVRVLSVCSGDGRDLLDVLAERVDGHAGEVDRVRATLVELHPEIAQAARYRAAAAGLRNVEVRTLDAGSTDAYPRAAPADIVLLVGIFGNISDEDLWVTIAAAPQLCRPGATLLWSRGRHRDDRNDEVRRRFREAGFTELDYATQDTGSRPALGLLRYDGPVLPLQSGRRLFTFLR